MKLSEIEQRYRARLLESFSDPPGASPPPTVARIEELVRRAEDELTRARAKAQRLVEAAEREAREAGRRAEDEGKAQLRAERRRMVGQQLKGRELLRVIELRAEEEGKCRGRAAGLVEAAREAAGLRRRAGRALAALEAAAIELRAERERRAVELASRMVEACLGLPVASLPALYRQAFTRFLAAAEGGGSARLRVACPPELAAFLRTLEPVAAGRVELEVDSAAPADRLRAFASEAVLELSPQDRRAELEAILLALAEQPEAGCRAEPAGDPSAGSAPYGGGRDGQAP